MQQRGIRPDAVDLLFRYGREAHDHRGRTIIYLDKAARRRMEREMHRPRPGFPPQARESFLKLRIYAVLGRSGDIVTVGHRYARIRRH
jgi:hypothetical protein